MVWSQKIELSEVDIFSISFSRKTSFWLWGFPWNKIQLDGFQFFLSTTSFTTWVACFLCSQHLPSNLTAKCHVVFPVQKFLRNLSLHGISLLTLLSIATRAINTLKLLGIGQSTHTRPVQELWHADLQHIPKLLNLAHIVAEFTIFSLANLGTLTQLRFFY